MLDGSALAKVKCMDQIRSNDPSRIILEGTSFVRCSSNRLGTVKTIKASRPYSSILEMPSLYPYLSAARWPTTWYANRKCRKYVLIIINHKTRQHYTWAHLHAWYYLFQRLNRQINQPFLSSPPASRAPLLFIYLFINSINCHVAFCSTENDCLGISYCIA